MTGKCRMQNEECRMKCRDRARRPWLPFRFLLSALCICVFAGCAKKGDPGPTSRPSTLRDRQDRALKDPFGYSPEVDRTDISGGGLSGFDREGFGKDMKNVLDP